ncbi:hypothetical protein AMTR_s00026p00152560 [Amborella trichopoda]|uniref:PB1 domain-containing protein n=1 Tax=Amborella trichopoda TaxID=13333 RepID=W1PRQ6_AMBTC|nr:hypothetical protein AMTR_s00026p00152560 [Amborella trichopoda]
MIWSSRVPPVSSSAIEMPGCVNTFSGIGNKPLTDNCPYDVVQRRPFTHKRGHIRIISLRRGIGFQELQKMVDVYGQRMVIKNQLPDEELDTLISVSCDEDLEKMMEEYDWLLKTSPAQKLHVYLFFALEPDTSVPGQGDEGSNLLSSKIPSNDAPRLANDVLRLANDASRVVNDAPRLANDAPKFTNGDPQLANGFSRVAYMRPNQLHFGEDAASLCAAATINTSGPSERILMSTMLQPGQTHSVDPSVRPQGDHLHAKLNLSVMPNLPVYGLRRTPSERPNVASTCDSRYTNSDKRISPGSMHASDSYCLSAQQPVVYVGVSYRAGFSGYPMGVPPSQNLRAGPSPSVNGKIRGQRFIPTPQILAEPKMEESSAGARV